MQLSKSSLRLFALAFLILIISNLVILFRVYLSHSSPPTTQITLTQRELRLPYKNKQDSSIYLRISYRVSTTDTSCYNQNNPKWLDTKLLKKLGFNIDQYTDLKYNKTIMPRKVFVVLQYGGVNYKNLLKNAKERVLKHQLLYEKNKNNKSYKQHYEDAKIDLQNEQLYRSKLFVIDAGLNPKKLRQKYDDDQKFIIVGAIVSIYRYHNTKNKKKFYGFIKKLLIPKIYVPQKYHYIFDYKTKNKLKYEVQLNYTNLYEPYIKSIKRISY
jgi:hypothetical protein